MEEEKEYRQKLRVEVSPLVQVHEKRTEQGGGNEYGSNFYWALYSEERQGKILPFKIKKGINFYRIVSEVNSLEQNTCRM